MHSASPLFAFLEEDLSLELFEFFTGKVGNRKTFDFAGSVLVGNYTCLLIYIVLCLLVKSYALLCELKFNLSSS